MPVKIIVVSGNPKKDGLTYSMTEKLLQGLKDGGADAEVVGVCGMGFCRSCNNGQCLTEKHKCTFGNDGFTAIQEKIKEADGAAFISPVYWEEVSEGLKSFLDRFRRCESSTPMNSRNAAFTRKPVLLVACAGGSGRDMLEPLMQLERFACHTGADIFDEIAINRRNSAYKGETIYNAAKFMAGSLNL